MLFRIKEKDGDRCCLCHQEFKPTELIRFRPMRKKVCSDCIDKVVKPMKAALSQGKAVAFDCYSGSIYALKDDEDLTMTDCQKIVEGFIEVIDIGEDLCLVRNKDSLDLLLPQNKAFELTSYSVGFMPVFGNVILMSLKTASEWGIRK